MQFDACNSRFLTFSPLICSFYDGSLSLLPFFDTCALHGSVSSLWIFIFFLPFVIDSLFWGRQKKILDFWTIKKCMHQKTVRKKLYNMWDAKIRHICRASNSFLLHFACVRCLRLFFLRFSKIFHLLLNSTILWNPNQELKCFFLLKFDEDCMKSIKFRLMVNLRF